MIERYRTPRNGAPDHAEADLVAEAEEEEHAKPYREKSRCKKGEELNRTHKPLFEIIVLALEIEHKEEEEEPYRHNDRSGKKSAEPIFRLAEDKIERIYRESVCEGD